VVRWEIGKVGGENEMLVLRRDVGEVGGEK